MIKRSLEQLLEMIPGAEPINAEPGLNIHGVSKDTRTIRTGMLYVPILGHNFDGHDFAHDAIAKGAVLTLWERNRPLPAEKLPLLLVDDTVKAMQQLATSYRNQLPVRVIAVTGSNGKTTTKDMIASVLSTSYKVHKTEGNLNTHISLPLTILDMTEDTEMAVLEMGMRGRGEIEELTLIARPEIAVVTMIGEAHLERLGSREEIAKAKVEILSGLQDNGLFVYHGDEPLLEAAIQEMPKPEHMLRYRFGVDSSSDLYPTGVMLEEEGVRFTISTDSFRSYYIPLLGKHNVSNALAAIAVGKFMGVDASHIATGLRNLQLSGMRMEMVHNRNGLTILNDAFNSSPTSCRAAIEMLQELKGYSRKIIVLGDMLELGEGAVQFHEEIGALLNPNQIDHVFTFGLLSQHIAKVASLAYTSGKVKSYTRKDELIRDIASLVRPDDVVLVKGSRGMALEEVVSHLARRP